ncbi:MAG: alpha-glucan family phosphorylase [Candidatus Nomurabacteria bacterium]|jgi:starch phosphorylase|nr:alpha-glucan family phosphorylase [Candidatus Nomurabacteria bacterium]
MVGKDITINERGDSAKIENEERFYEAIKRQNLSEKLSPERPYVYFTMEVYDKKNGIKGGGGLGVLAADTRRVAERFNVPFVLVTPFYPWESHQELAGGAVKDVHVNVHPEEFGFELVDTVSIKTVYSSHVPLSIYQKLLGSTRFLCMTEPDFGELYSGDGSGDHRLYQEVALGFGGYKAMKAVGVKPAIIQLNETATFFAALARLDELVYNGMDLYEAIVYVRKHTLYTNHTLVQAAESEFSFGQFQRFVFPNLRTKSLKRWIANQFQDGRLKLSSITIELAELRSGVSKLHARVANYKDLNGERIKFVPITNGIDIHEWVNPKIVQMYHDKGILNRFDIPTPDYQTKIEQLSIIELRDLKLEGRRELNKVLEGRKNQHGGTVQVPEDATLFNFKRRFVDYKRPWLPFTDVARLREILENHNAYYILSGKVHAGDFAMANRLKEILTKVEKDKILKGRVFYIEDYDEQLALALSLGADVSINNPIVGLEACGTSWEKDIANLQLLISTADGGVADETPAVYLEITGRSETDEVTSLYNNMRFAGEVMKNNEEWSRIIKDQLAAYLPVISGARMLKDYLNLLFK